MNNLNLTLNDIDKGIIDHLPEDPSYLIRKIYSLKNKKFKDYEVEDLRILIGQEISLAQLVPMAIDVLRANILAEGDFYEGDLLCNVLKINEQYWKSHRSEASRLLDICQQNKKLIDNFDTTDKIRNGITEDIRLLKSYIK